jgi:hypothetical protein
MTKEDKFRITIFPEMGEFHLPPYLLQAWRTIYEYLFLPSAAELIVDYVSFADKSCRKHA